MSEKETMKSEIIKYAMSKIGTKRVSTLDGMTLEYKNKCYNIYVDDNNVTVEEIDDLDEYEELDEIIENENLDETDRGRINYFMETHSFPSISDMYNDKCFCCPADRKGNECKGKETCGKTWKRYEAITNPEWHHVSLATLDNIDFNTLDRKRQVYLKAHRELKRTLADLSKCKTGHTYEARARKFMRDMISQYYDNEISYAMRKYLDLQLSMSNVANGVWSSYVEPATGLHESRRYSRPTLTYSNNIIAVLSA